MPQRDTQGKELAREARAMAIYEFGKKHRVDNLKIEKAIADNWSMKRWKDLVFSDVMERTEIEKAVAAKQGFKPINPDEQFSLRRYILDKITQKPTSAQNQRAIDKETARLSVEKVQAKRGDFIPASVLNPIITRALTVGTPSEGGFTVASELEKLVTPLDKDFPIQSLSSNITSTLPYSLPKVTNTTVAEWTAETTKATEANLTFESVRVIPKYLRAWTTVSRELVMNSSTTIENFVRAELRLALREGIERGAVTAGGSGQPVGLQNNSSIPTRTYTASALTFDDVLNAEQAILDANVAIQHVRTHMLVNGEQVTTENNPLRERLSLDWVCSPSFKRLAKQTAQLGGGSLPIWDTGNEGEDEVVTVFGEGLKSAPKILGYNAHISPFVAAGEAYFGNWREHLISSTGPIELLVDPYTLSTRGLIRISAFVSLDFSLRHDSAIVRLMS